MKKLGLIVLFCVMSTLGLSLPPVAQSAGESSEQVVPEPDADSPRADLSQANELVRAQKYAEAEEILGDLQDRYPEDTDLLTMRGELLIALSQAREAVEVLRTAARLDPRRPRLQFQLGSALAATGQAEAAIEAFGEELKNNDDPRVLVLARLNRSFLYQQHGAPADGAKELEAVVELEPGRAPVYGDLVALYLELGRTDEAADALSRGEAHGFESASHAYSIGARFGKDGNYERAVDLFTRSLEIDPEFADSERSLAAALEQLGREEEAAKHLRRYLELRPDDPDAEAIAAKIRAVEES
jgi:tetratricopeptide (TPR) repeat protein